MLKKIAILLIVTMFCSFMPPVQSQDFLNIKDPGTSVTLVTGEINVFPVESPQRVSIRNPEIADVSKVGDDEVVVVAKEPGDTVLVVWDNKGKREYFITVYPQNLEMAKKRLEKLVNEDLGISGVSFKMNPSAGRVMVLGDVTAEEKVQIETIIASYNERAKATLVDNLLKIKEETRMVEIECQVFELTKSFTDAIGFDWPGTAGADPTPMMSLTAGAGSAGSLRDVFKIVDWTRTSMQLDIMAAVTEGKGKVLARPKLLCLSGQEADFLVGGEVPVVTVTSTSAGDTVAEDVEYKEYGVKLNIRPTVLAGGDVKLNVTTEVKELSTTGQYIRSDGTIIRAFKTRTTSTLLRLNEGQGIIMSGLLEDKVTKDDINKVPGLGDIPILGALFRSKEYQDEQTELVISLTPKVIDVKDEEAAELATPTKRTPCLQSRIAVYPDYLQKEDLLNDYILQVQKIIFNSLSYPRLAKDAGWQGTVKIKLHLNYDGDLLDARIAESSGYLSFDDNVMAIARSLEPYPSFPTSVDIEDLWIDIPIVYKMD